MLRTLTAIIAAVAALSLAACGDDAISVTVKEGTTSEPSGAGDAEKGRGVRIDNEGETRSERCTDGAPVTINAAGVKLMLTGQCGPLVVNGDSANVTADSVRSIVFNGDSSSVTYASGTPSVTANGDGNRADRG